MSARSDIYIKPVKPLAEVPSADLQAAVAAVLGGWCGSKWLPAGDLAAMLRELRERGNLKL